MVIELDDRARCNRQPHVVADRNRTPQHDRKTGRGRPGLVRIHRAFENKRVDLVAAAGVVRNQGADRRQAYVSGVLIVVRKGVAGDRGVPVPDA